jgi:hypothetical protein
MDLAGHVSTEGCTMLLLDGKEAPLAHLIDGMGGHAGVLLASLPMPDF